MKSAMLKCSKQNVYVAAHQRQISRDPVFVHTSRHLAQPVQLPATCQIRAQSTTVIRSSPTSVSDAPLETKAVVPEANVPGMSAFLDSLKWDNNGLIAVVAQVRCRV